MLRKTVQTALALCFVVLLSNAGLAAVNISFPLDGSSHPTDQPLGVYGQAPAGHKISVTVEHGSAAVTKINIITDGNGFWNASFAVPTGGWNAGAGLIKARDTDDDTTDEHDITFTE